MNSMPPAEDPIDGDDRTARARIRDAAIARFADDGVAGTSVRAIAGQAGVSPALIIHHFGSKDALRTACDEHVAATIRERKQAAMAAGPGLDPVAALRCGQEGPPLLRYLARTLVDATPQVAALVDEMVADAAAYMAEGVGTGVLRPTEHPYGRAAVVTVWTLGALVLHEHVHRLLGANLTGSPDQVAAATAYFGPALEVLSDGLITEAAAARMRAAFAAARADPEEHEEQEAGS
ncbi:MAG: TetR/AcrR family transcriptional regulator [Egibacteraceae bacterium]